MGTFTSPRGSDGLEQRHSHVIAMNPTVSVTLAGRPRAKRNPSYLMPSRKVLITPSNCEC